MASRQESLTFTLADVSRLMRRTFERRLEGNALTLAQARVLIRASRHEGLRQVELAELLEVQPITLARLIDQLETAGLLERRMDPADRRAYRVFPTPAAAPHLQQIERLIAEIRSEALRGLTKPQASAVADALKIMRDNLAAR